MQWLQAQWPAPSHIKTCITTRTDGFSIVPYDSFNLASHVGDDVINVNKNRQLLRTQLKLPSEPCWLNQVHGTKVLRIDQPTSEVLEADGSFTRRKSIVCVVLTADCLPLLVCDKKGTTIATVHAGWRGLANGIIDRTIAALDIHPTQLFAWLGPAISQSNFEVGNEVKAIFSKLDYQTDAAFRANNEGKWYLDIYRIAKANLQKLGVENIYGGDQCTFRQKEKYFSYRRDGTTGRMASLIWMQK